jgi:hypothetical protein
MIISTVLVAINGVFFTALHLREATVNAIEANLPTEEALEIMQYDLANLIASTNLAPSNSVLIGPLQTTTTTNALPDQIGPDFYTTGGEPDGMVPWGDIQKVDYLLSTPTNGVRRPGRDLIRAVTRNLLPISQPPQPDEKRAILSGVQSLTFLYYDGTQWDADWDTTQETNLPEAIKVQIKMAAVPGAGTPLQLDLVVPVDVLLNTNPISAIQ